MGRGQGGSTSHGKRTAGVVKTSGIGAASAMKAAEVQDDGVVVSVDSADGTKTYNLNKALLGKIAHHIGDLSNEAIDELRDVIGLGGVNVPSVIREIGKAQPITEKLYRLVAIDLEDGELAKTGDGDLGLEVWQKEKYSDLDDNEKVALREYTDLKSQAMNDYLRGLNTALTDLADTEKQIKAESDENVIKALKRRRDKAVTDFVRYLSSGGQRTIRKFVAAAMNGLAKMIDAQKNEPPLLVTRGAQEDSVKKDGDVVYEPAFRSASSLTTNEGAFTGSPRQFVFFTVSSSAESPSL